MKTKVMFAAIAVVLVMGFRWVEGQSPSRRGIVGQANSRVSGERSTRQAEVLRLQEEIDRLGSRVERLERNSMGSENLPAFTIPESKAALAYAELKLETTQRQLEEGEASELQLASDRMMFVRAKTQLQLAEGAHADRRLALETEVAFAERHLTQERRRRDELERLVARGLTTSVGIELQAHDLQLAENALVRVRQRLKLHEALAK